MKKILAIILLTAVTAHAGQSITNPGGGGSSSSVVTTSDCSSYTSKNQVN